MHIQFLGANRQVTGSCYYIEAAGLKLMVDCGLFQERPFLPRNWEKLPIDVAQLDYLLLTHAHLDHCGRIPTLMGQGFKAPILTTAPSAELARIIMLDAARIQEEDAAYKKRRHEREGRKGPHPVQPLYTEEQAQRVLPLMRVTHFDEVTKLNEQVSVRFHCAGHILGAAMVELTVKENGQARRVLFSGDIGQWDIPMVRDPSIIADADLLIMESTYGDRDHEQTADIPAKLAQIVHDALERGGNIIIPTFAVERAQLLMYYLGQLVHQKKIPQIMVYLDSPMAVNVTDVFRRHRTYMDSAAQALYEAGEPPFRFPGLELVRTIAQSKAINRIKGTCIILAGSGMCTGGRIKHHLVANISRPESTVLFVGYQAHGTLGRQIVQGDEQVRIHGQMHPVRAKIEQLHGLSAHADRTALLGWVKRFQKLPREILLTHGEEEAALSLAQEVEALGAGKVSVPQYLDARDL
jgi:metallo-beta-lactamase family protein